MSSLIRIPRKFTGYFVLFAMLNWLFLPVGVVEKRVIAEQNQAAPDKQLNKGEIKNIVNKAELYFEANQGQLDKRVRFSARGAGYKLFLTSSEAVYIIPERKTEEVENPQSESGLAMPQAAKSSRAVAIWMKLIGASQEIAAVGVGELAGKHNYFKGSDESKWQSNVPLYQSARFDNVYEGVIMEWHGNAAGSIEYDFKIAPNVSTRQIEWQIEGADKVTVEADGSLVISTPFGELKQNAPVTYQETEGLRSAVESRFELRGETSVGFALGDYDESKPLTIDPVTDLNYSTFLGGDADESGNAVATTSHDAGVYVTGSTSSSTFPATAGVFDESSNGSNDVFVTKFNEDGTQLVYSTYIGGGGNDVGYGIAVDSSGNAYITGGTLAFDTPYPTTGNAPFPDNNGGKDAFVTKLNAGGSALLYSTFLGGAGNDEGYGIALRSNRAYVTGYTNSTNFPITPDAWDVNYSGMQDIFVTRLDNAGASLEYSTYLGGTSTETGRGIAVDSLGNAYIAGQSLGQYPTNPEAFQPAVRGANDAVVTKLNANGSGIVYSTYIGGEENDGARAIAVDTSGNAYITGSTVTVGAIGFPTTVGAFDPTRNGVIDAYVTKFNSTGTALVYSTMLGGSNEDTGNAIAVNAAGNAFVTGVAGNSYPVTPGAFDTTYNGGSYDVFLTKLNTSGSGINYSTFIGGSSDEYGNGIALNPSGEAFITGATGNGTTNFPTTFGAVQPQINGPSDAFVSKFVAMPDVLPPAIGVVTNTNDGGAGSLRQALQNANETAEDDIIQFSPLFNTPQTISISDHLQIASNATIQGPGANLLTVRNTSPATFVSRVFNMISGIINVSGMTMSGGKGNLSGGGIYNAAALTVNNCAVSGNSVIQGRAGGGIYNLGTLNLFNSTVSGNSSGASNVNGAIYNEGTLNVTNTTVSGNPSRGINSSGTASVINITNSTIVNNVIDMNATGVYLFHGNVTIRNSIIAGNYPGNGPDVQVAVGTLVSGGYNLIGNASAVTAFITYGDQTGSTEQPLNPQLAPLAFNGGTTQTHALLPNSTAIDKGSRFGSNTDQRDFIRPFDTPGAFNLADGSDIGAFESQGNKTPFDFDGDNKTDIAIFRPSAGEWWINRSSNATGYALQFGASTDRIAPADFTGDGKTDIAFFRPANGSWFVLRSEDNSFYSFPFGANGDIPAPADFDGDNKADAAVFRPSDSTWYISKSSGGTIIQQFGQSGDVPVVADYDGDGKADMAIYRVSQGEWWIRRSSNGTVYAFQFGASTDKPVQGDYTGDGKSDVAFWQPSSGFWFILRSEDNSFFSFPFGAAGDLPVPGDYDGDGKFDASVFRPSNSTWYSQRTTAGTLIQTFGIAGDKPIPNAFVP